MYVCEIFEQPDCRLCPLQREVKVPPEGDLNAKVALVGEGPGYNEVENGHPFIGRAGGMLNQLLERAGGPPRKQLFITNAALCMPRYIDLDYDEWCTKKEALEQSTLQYCRGRLLRELARVHPRVVLAVGAYALRSLTGLRGILKHHGGLIAIDTQWLANPVDHPDLSAGNVTYVIPMLHPAALLRGETRQAQVVIDVMKKAFRIAEHGIEAPGAQLLVTPFSPRGADRSIDDLENVVNYLCATGGDIGVDVETTEEDARHATLTVVGFGVPELGVAVSILTWDPLQQVFRSCWTPEQRQRVFGILTRLLSTRKLVKWFWNMNFDITVLSRYFPTTTGPFADGIHYHWLAQPDTHHNLAWGVQQYLDVRPWKAYYWDRQKSNLATDRDLLIYNAEDSRNTAAVIPHLRRAVNERRNLHLVKHQLRVTALAHKAYLRGIPVSRERLDEARTEYTGKRDGALGTIQKAIAPAMRDLNAYVQEVRRTRARASATNKGTTFKEPKAEVVTPEAWNPRSPDQASWFIYEFLKLPVTRLTAGGEDKDPTRQRPSWSYKAVLDHLKKPFVQEFVDFGEFDYRLRRLTEIESHIDPLTSSLHIPWNTTGQAGPRWVSKPNVQNWDKKLKKMTLAPPGYTWVGADAAQLEMRILACLAGIKRLLDIFNAPAFDERAEPWKKLDPRYDSHSLVCAMVYGDGFLNASDDDKNKMRTMVKRVVYGMNYGAYPDKIRSALLEDKRLALALRAEIAQPGRVETVFDGFHSYFPEVDRWATAEVAKVRTDGLQVIAPFNRHRWWPIREVEETKIRNTPIQVAAADIVNDLFVRMDDEVVANGLDSTMVVHGHDACYWLTAELHAQQVQQIVNKNFHFYLDGPAGKVHIHGQASIGPTTADVA